ncbi:hypothetical protein PRIPAC_95606 [Pristionchus pacificus]|uniref:JmjC domain-containing protein n=1 Tax=Pristionchus pacificus TaxID=54126 RepID=A0A2A6CU01_PRIPA|nr:hypothetical protein PRIPAC_95606 [Pristionchus pacificus]|eukprot:PDM81580.1 hypothetical protein PRIPAC_30561 [Pristionchus pacificus]
MRPQDAHHRAVVNNGRPRNTQPMRFVPVSRQFEQGHPRVTHSSPGCIVPMNHPHMSLPNQQAASRPSATQSLTLSKVEAQLKEEKERKLREALAIPIKFEATYNREKIEQRRRLEEQQQMSPVDPNNRFFFLDHSGHLRKACPGMSKKSDKGEIPRFGQGVTKGGHSKGISAPVTKSHDSQLTPQHQLLNPLLPALPSNIDDEGYLIEEGEMPSNDTSISHSSFSNELSPLDPVVKPKVQSIHGNADRREREEGAESHTEHAPYIDPFGQKIPIDPIIKGKPCYYDQTHFLIQYCVYGPERTGDRLWWRRVDTGYGRLVQMNEAQEIGRRIGAYLSDKFMRSINWAIAVADGKGASKAPSKHGKWRAFKNTGNDEDETKEAPIKPGGSKKRKTAHSDRDEQGRRRKLDQPAPTRPTDATIEYEPRRAPQNSVPPAPVAMLARPIDGGHPIFVTQPNSMGSYNDPSVDEFSAVSSPVAPVPRKVIPPLHNSNTPKAPAFSALAPARNAHPVDIPHANQAQQAPRPQYGAGRVLHRSALNMIREGEEQYVQSGYWSPAKGVSHQVPENTRLNFVPESHDDEHEEMEMDDGGLNMFFVQPPVPNSSTESIEGVITHSDDEVEAPTAPIVMRPALKNTFSSVYALMVDEDSNLSENSTPPTPIIIEESNYDADDEIGDGDEQKIVDALKNDKASVLSGVHKEMNKVGLLHNLDHMSEEQQMDYILNGTSYDHEEIFEDVNDEVDEKRPTDPPSHSPLISDHSTRVIPPLQEPPSKESHDDDDEIEDADGGLIMFEQDDIMEEEKLAKSLEETTVSSAVHKEALSLERYIEDEQIALGIAESLKKVNVLAETTDPAPIAQSLKISEQSIHVVPPLQKLPSEVLPQPVPLVDGVAGAVDLASIVNISLYVNESNIGDYTAEAQQLIRVLLEIVRKGMPESKALATGGSADKVSTEQHSPADSALHEPRDVSLPVAQPASIIPLHSMIQRQIYSSRSSSEENDDTQGSSLGGNSASSSPALDLGEESATVQGGYGGEEAESSIISTSGIDDDQPNRPTIPITDKTVDIPMDVLLASADDLINEQSKSIFTLASQTSIDEKVIEEVEHEKDRDDIIDNEDLVEEESITITNSKSLPIIDDEDMEKDGDEKDVEETDHIDNEEKPIEPTEALRAEEAKAKKFGIRGRVSKAMDVKEREVAKIAKPVIAKPTRGRCRPRKTAVEEESQQQSEEPHKGRSQLRTMEQLSQDEDPQLYLLLVKDERQKTGAHRGRSAQVTHSKRNALKMLENQYKQMPQVDSNTKTYTMSTLHQIENQLDISCLPVDSDGNLVGQPLAEPDNTVPTTRPIVNADEAELDSVIEREDETSETTRPLTTETTERDREIRPPGGFSIIAPRRENVVEVVGSHFEDLFETNTAPIRPPPRPPLQPRTEYATTPIIKVNTKEEANSDKLRQCVENLPICMLRGIIEAMSIDLEIFSAESLHKNHPKQRVELRTQLKFDDETCMTVSGQETWEYKSMKKKSSISEFMANYRSSIQIAVEAVLGSGKRTMDGTQIKFGTNIDMTRQQMKFMREFAELDKLPAFCRMSALIDLLRYLEHKVPGNRTPAHLENNNLSSVNINIGPGTCTWYACDFKYWGYINEELEKRGINFLRGSWWPDSELLLSLGVPVYKFKQYPGDIVVVGPGSAHWVQADGWCSNIAWNICLNTHTQLTMAIHQYERNFHQKYESLLPIQYFFWILAMKNIITDPKVFALVKATLSRSLANCYTMVDYVEKKLGRKLEPLARAKGQKELIAHRTCNWMRKFEGEKAYSSCEVECFNILFVKKKKESSSVAASDDKNATPVASLNADEDSSETTKIDNVVDRSKNGKRDDKNEEKVEENIEQAGGLNYCAKCIWKAGKGFDDYDMLLEIPLETLQRIYDNMKLKTAEPDSASSSSSLPRLPMGKKKATPKKKNI